MVSGLELGWWDVAAGPVEPFGIPPGNPGRGDQLELVDRPPRASVAHVLGLVEAHSNIRGFV